MVERYVRDVEAASSNLVTSTKNKKGMRSIPFLFLTAVGQENLVAKREYLVTQKTVETEVPAVSTVFWMCQNQEVIKISRPMKIRMAPPRMPALPARQVPTLRPMRIPPRQITKVTAAIRAAARTASIRP